MLTEMKQGRSSPVRDGTRRTTSLRHASAVVGLRATSRHAVKGKPPGNPLVLALADAGALSVGTPARGPAFLPSATIKPSVVSAQLGDLLESAALAPNTVEQSWLRVDVNQTRRPATAPVTGVTASLVGPDARVGATRSLARTEIDGRWELGGVDLTAAGRWEMTITVQRAGHAATVWHTSTTIANSPGVARQPLISDRPWGRVPDDIALTVALLTFATASIAMEVRRRRRPGISTEPGHVMPSEERMRVSH